MRNRIVLLRLARRWWNRGRLSIARHHDTDISFFCILVVDIDSAVTRRCLPKSLLSFGLPFVLPALLVRLLVMSCHPDIAEGSRWTLVSCRNEFGEVLTEPILSEPILTKLKARQADIPT